MTADVEIARPIAAYLYYDKLTIWLLVALTVAELRQLRRLLRGTKAKVRIKNKPHRFLPQYRQRIQLYQPNRAALQFLAGRAQRITQAELSLDQIHINDDNNSRAFDYMHVHFVKDRHGKQVVKLVKGKTRYTGSRNAPNLLVVYSDLHCRITGEIPCLHLDWRVNRTRYLQRIGIGTIGDLLAYDHQRFWQQRLKLYEADLEKVGRAYWNWYRGEHRRQPRLSQWYGHGNHRMQFNYDLMMGRKLLRFANYTIQGLVDNHQRFFNVRAALTPVLITNLYLLPEDVSL